MHASSLESQIKVSNLGQCVTGFLKGQYSATVMSQDIAFTAEEKMKSITASILMFTYMAADYLRECKVDSPGTFDTVKALALCSFLWRKRMKNKSQSAVLFLRVSV